MYFSRCCPSLLMKRGSVQVQKNPQPPAKPEKPKFRGFRSTLRSLRDRLRTDHRTMVSVQHLAVSFSPQSILSQLSSFTPFLSPLSPLILSPSRLQRAVILLSREDIWSAVIYRTSVLRTWMLSPHLSARQFKVPSSCTHSNYTLVTRFLTAALICHLSTSDLSSELVGLLQVRDQLRTEQDAMLLEVQDLTSL